MRRPLRFAKTRAHASEEDIKRFERRWELRLPPAIRTYCIEVNGGIPSKENNFYPVPDRYEAFWKEYDVIPNFPVGVGLTWFLALAPNLDNMTVEKTMKLLADSGQLLPNRVPLADDGCGNLVMASVGVQDFGRIYFWDHELHFEYPIAENFTEFLDGLTSEPELPRH